MIENSNLTDWHSLRNQSIAILQNMNGEHLKWTDYNVQDPGITLLESLCFAITDLGYRLKFPIQDLLAFNTHFSGKGRVRTVFLAPEQVLTTPQVTLSDYIQWCTEQPGITGAWLRRHKTGLYQLFLGVSKKESLNDRYGEILQQLNERRNIGEKFVQGKLLPNKAIIINIELNLKDEAIADDIYLVIEQQIEHFLTNSISQSIELATQPCNLTLANEKSTKSENLNNEHQSYPLGLEQTRHFPVIKLDKSALLLKLQAITGIEQVTKMSLTTSQTLMDKNESEHQILEIHEAIPFVLSGNESGGSKLRLSQFGQITTKNLNEIEPHSPVPPPAHNPNKLSKLNYPQGKYRFLYVYETVQNELPEYYGVGKFGLSDIGNGNDAADHLRCYLILFDLLLNDYFAQVEGLKVSFSMIDQCETIAGFYSQPLHKDAGYDLVKNPNVVDDPKYIENMKMLDQQQQNKMLNYLLAQHGEDFMPFEVFEFFPGGELNNSQNNSDKVSTSRLDKIDNYLKYKKYFLTQIVLLRGQRGRLMALQKILRLRLAMADDQLWLVDNVILIPEIGLPVDKGGFKIGSKTPHNPPFRVANSENCFCAIILPKRLENKLSKDYLERVFTEEIPAHLFYYLIYEDVAFEEEPSNDLPTDMVNKIWLTLKPKLVQKTKREAQ